MLTRFLLALAALTVFAAPAHAVRIKDLGTFQGVRPNQLVGYGIVVGLAVTITAAAFLSAGLTPGGNCRPKRSETPRIAWVT